MADEQMEEIRRRQAEGARAMSSAELAQRQRDANKWAQNRERLTIEEQLAMRNFWGGSADQSNAFIPDQPAPTLWTRIKQWIKE